MKKTFDFIKQYLKQYKARFLIYLLFCFIYSIFSFISPYISGNFIDALLGMREYEELVKYCALFGTLSIGIIIINFAVNQIFTYLKINIGYEINKKFLHHIRNVPILEMQKYTVAAITQKINYDTGIVTTFVLQTAQHFLINVITLILPLTALLQFNLKIGIVLIGLIVVYLITYMGFKKPLYKCCQDTREKETTYFNELYKQFGYSRFIKMNVVQPFFDLLLKKIFRALLSSSIHTQKIAYLFASLDKIIMMAAQISLFIFGGMQVIDRKLSIGQFTIISTYFSMIMGAVRYFFGLGKSMQDMQVSLERLCELLSIPEEKYGEMVIDKVDCIKMESIDFTIENKKIFTDFSGKFIKGNIYGIIGENGSGKSTLLNILTGMYWQPEEAIYINQVPMRQCNLNQIRRDKIGILEQEPVLLEESIRQNLFLGGEDKSKSEQFTQLCKVLGLDKFFLKLSKGLDTVVNEEAMNLSGGEKQKLALLRVLMKDTDVLILDEPTSAMDIESQKKLYSYLSIIKKDRIIVIVSHDQQITDKVDCVINLSKKIR